ncbi:MAG: CaiB/BaiF CoA transferase family protein [Methyloligellaceae bacterium]
MTVNKKMVEQALDDITVLDFSRFLPAPYCSMTLADFGARVIRVEQANEVAKQEKAFGLDNLTPEEKRKVKKRELLSRNKRSVILNLRDENSRKAVKRMIKNCDVLLHDYRAGVMEAMGLGYDELRIINPKLIYCSVTLGGLSGPYQDLPGHEPIAMALAGALPRFGDGDRPHIAGLPVGDLSTGMQAVIGILLALQARNKTGEGQLVDVAMSDCALNLMTSVAQRFLVSEKEPPLSWRGGNVGYWLTLDNKYICTTDLEPRYWEKFCHAIERSDLLPLQFDKEKLAYLDEELRQVFSQKTRDQWFEILRQAGTQVAPVYTIAEALQDRHARARGTVFEMNDGDGHAVTQIGPAVKLSATPGSVRDLPHLPGQDTLEILKEFGFSDDEIEPLIIASVAEIVKT